MKSTGHLACALRLALASMLVAPLYHCGSDDSSDAAGSEQTAELLCWVAAPGDGTVIDGQLSIEIGFSGPVGTIELVVDGAVVDRSTVDGTDKVTFNWTPPADATYRIVARAHGSSSPASPVDSEPVSVVVDTLAPVIKLDLPRLSIVNGELEVPFSLTEANPTRVSLKDKDGQELASTEEPDSSLVWNTAAGVDGVHWLQVEATDAAGHTTLSETVPTVVLNNGEEVDVKYIPEAEVAVPANYASVEYHTRVATPAKRGVRAVITWVTWEDESWKLEYSVGQGFCPHRGIQYLSHEGSEGEIVLELARTELAEDVVAKLPAAERTSETFPFNNDPATFGSFFGHINPLEPADHVNQSMPIQVHYVLLY